MGLRGITDFVTFMRRQLILLCITGALFLNGWSGALAALLCPHAGGRMMSAAARPAGAGSGEAAVGASILFEDDLPACCRNELTEEKHCPMWEQKSVEDGERAADETESLECESGVATDAAAGHHEEAAASFEHRGRPEKEEQKEQPQATARASGTRSGSGQQSPRAFRPRSSSCAHCAGRPEQPNTNTLLREQPGAKRGDEGEAAHAPSKPLEMPSVSFFPTVVPSQGAPPGAARRRHLLISVFLI